LGKMVDFYGIFHGIFHEIWKKNGIHRTMNKYFGMQLRFKNDKETV
jgi:hypothetical protein